MTAVVARLVAFRAAIAGMSASSTAVTTVAVGWGTVDLDRAIGELVEALGLTPDRFSVAPDTQLLGARCRVASAALPDGSTLAVLEPTTEGRLAATLGRIGEGPAAIWLEPAGGDGLGTGTGCPTDHTLVPLATSSERDGPFGPERLVLGGPTYGPHRLLVGPPGTIRA